MAGVCLVRLWCRRMPACRFALLALVCCVLTGCPPDPEHEYDVILRGGTVYDGSGQAPRIADVGLRADTVAALGDLRGAIASQDLDVSGLAVAPGFINMLSWATTSLLIDGRAQSDIQQGVTLEVMGEGWSMGPLNAFMQDNQLGSLVRTMGSVAAAGAVLGQTVGPDSALSLPWTTLGEYLAFLEEQGVAPNVASFVGATTLRIHEVGFADRPATPEELAAMQDLARQAMEEGALGIGSSLIYAPAFYAPTEELIALGQAVAPYGGMYVSHLRSEGNRLLEALDELITIAREADMPAEVYHLKAAGQANWPKLDEAIARIEAARAEGLAITADMYTYTAGATGLNAAMPPWVQEGGFGAWRRRLQDPALRPRVVREMQTPTDAWENFFVAAGPENILLLSFDNPALRGYVGQTLAEVAAERGTSPAVTAMDLVVEDSSRVNAAYFLMSEDNVRRQVQLPWMSFGSDAGALAAEGRFLEGSTHPRAYGNFARLLGRYVREEGLVPLEEAIRRLTALPADNLKLDRRGRLQVGHYADVAVFDPAAIQDHATFEAPHQYATGMVHVLVNGTLVLQDGTHTGARPGRFVRGPGAKAAQ